MSEPVVQDEQILRLAPSLFSAGGPSPEVDNDVHEMFRRLYKPLRDGGLEPYHLSRVASALYYYRPLLARLLNPTHQKHVVEVGCGFGWKALAWADLFASYTGIELYPDHAAEAEGHLRDFGVRNGRVIAGNATAVLADPAAHGVGPIDLLVLYAVLEHLTIGERRAILKLAQQVYLQGGAVLIAESPNRLCRVDQHSWHLPFADWLPDELLAEYALRSPRGDLTSQLAAAPPEGRLEKLYRLGRGISYHEFECFWDAAALEAVNIVNDGYSTELLNMYPFMRDEYDLLTFCKDYGCKFPRMFTRFWIEGLWVRGAVGVEGRAVNYAPPGGLTSVPVRERRRYSELDEVVLSSGRKQTMALAAADGRSALVLIDSSRSTGGLVVEDARGRISATIDLDKVARGRLPAWHSVAALPVPVPAGAGSRLRADGRGAALTCHGLLYV